MRVKIHSPLLDIELDDEGRYGDVDALDEFMADRLNIISYPTYALTSEYDPDDPQSIYWATLMYVAENTPGEIEIEMDDFEPTEPGYEKPREARY